MIRSLDDLQQYKDAIQIERGGEKSLERRVAIALGTCGIAAGALDTMQAFLSLIETSRLEGILVTQTGCLGLCKLEPVVQVRIAGQPAVLYGRVTPEIARQIFQQHLIDGKILQARVIAEENDFLP